VWCAEPRCRAGLCLRWRDEVNAQTLVWRGQCMFLVRDNRCGWFLGGISLIVGICQYDFWINTIKRCQFSCCLAFDALVVEQGIWFFDKAAMRANAETLKPASSLNCRKRAPSMTKFTGLGWVSLPSIVVFRSFCDVKMIFQVDHTRGE
jgi:hypothetical protein